MAFDTAKADLILTGFFQARATYGDEYIAEPFWVKGDNDAEKADDYRGYLASQGFDLLDQSDLPTFDDRGGSSTFTVGGLFDSRVVTTFSSGFDAQGLLSVKGGDTLVLSFRGTDGKDPAVIGGQTFTGEGVAQNYKAFKPLINAALDYLKDHEGITNVVVSGHSLGGAMTDVFTMVDADRFRALRPDGLTIVSMGSSGVPKDLGDYLSGIDADTVVLKDNGNIESLVRPADYFAFANAEDRAHYPNDFPDIPEDLGLVPIVALKNNLQFGGDTVFNMPNMDNSDVIYYDILAHPFDFRGMGAEHSSALLWANMQGLVTDDLFGHYDHQSLIMGLTNYNAVPDIAAGDLALFDGYIHLDDPNFKNDRGSRALQGSEGEDFIMGLKGNDQLAGAGGNDLLSGGEGADRIAGGSGDDVISGGLGQDKLSGGGGADVFVYTAAGQSVHNKSDIISGFEAADRIDFSAIDADASTAGDQALSYIGSAPFGGLGEVRLTQEGDDVLVRVNLTNARGAELEILITNTLVASLGDGNFIL